MQCSVNMTLIYTGTPKCSCAWLCCGVWNRTRSNSVVCCVCIKSEIFVFTMNSFLLINTLPNIGCVLVQASGRVSEQDIHRQSQRRAGAGTREDQRLLVSIVAPRCHRCVIACCRHLDLGVVFHSQQYYTFLILRCLYFNL